MLRRGSGRDSGRASDRASVGGSASARVSARGSDRVRVSASASVSDSDSVRASDSVHVGASELHPRALLCASAKEVRAGLQLAVAYGYLATSRIAEVDSALDQVCAMSWRLSGR